MFSVFINANMRFCPSCLKAQGWCHIEWHLTRSVACAKHAVWLEDSCPNCHTLFGGRNTTLDTCACGLRWKSIVSRRCPETVENMQRFIEAKPYKGRLRRRMLLSGIDSLTLKQRLSFLQTVSYFTTPPEASRQSTMRKLRDTRQWYNVAKSNADTLFNGESGFYDFLKQLWLQGSPDCRKGIRSLIRFHRAFYRNFQTRCLLEL